MGGFIIAGVLVLAVVLLVTAQDRAKVKRRQKWAKMRFSEEEREALAEIFKLYNSLPEEIKDSLDGLAHVFIEEKGFEPCGGLEEVTPLMQRVIAVQACLLIVNRPHDMYRSLRTVLVYPEAFGYDEGGVRLGESWNTGTVILSWAAVLKGGGIVNDGHDVSLHEFSHQLDQQNSNSQGVPELTSGSAYREWAKAFAPAFDAFCRKVDAGKKTVFDEYGATNPAEFFAVATETFFEKPKQLQKKYPDLYTVLKDYYRLDPSLWK